MATPVPSFESILTEENIRNERVNPNNPENRELLDERIRAERQRVAARQSQELAPLGRAPELPSGPPNLGPPVAADEPVDLTPTADLAGGVQTIPVTSAQQFDITRDIQQSNKAFRDYAAKYAELEDMDADDRRTEMVRWMGDLRADLQDPRNITYAKAINELITADDAPVGTFQELFGDRETALQENADRYARLRAVKNLRLGPAGRQVQTALSALTANYDAEISTNDLYNRLVEDYESAQINTAANRGEDINGAGVRERARLEAVRLAKEEVDRVKAVGGADLFSMTADVDALAEQQEEAADATLVPAADFWQARLAPRGIRMDGPLPVTMDAWDKAKIKGASGLGILGQYLDAFDPMELGADVLKTALQEKERERQLSGGEGTFKSDVVAPYLAAAAGTAMMSPTTSKTTEWLYDAAQGAINLLPDDAASALREFVPDAELVNRVQRNMVAAAVDEQDMFDAATDTLASLVPGMDPKTGRAVAREYATLAKTAALAGAIAVPGPDLLSGAAKGLRAGASKVLREAAIKKVDRVADALEEVVQAADNDPDLDLGQAMNVVAKDRRLTDTDRALLRARIAADYIDAAAENPVLLDEQIDTLEKVIGLGRLKTTQSDADAALDKLASEILDRRTAFKAALQKTGDTESDLAAAVAEAAKQRVAPPPGVASPTLPRPPATVTAEVLSLAKTDIPGAFGKVSEWFASAGRYVGHLDELAEAMDEAVSQVGQQLKVLKKAQATAGRTAKDMGDQARALMLQVQNAPPEVQEALRFLADFDAWRQLPSPEDIEKSALFQTVGGGDWANLNTKLAQTAAAHKAKVDAWVAGITDASVLASAKALVDGYDKQSFGSLVGAMANRRMLERSQTKAARTAARVRARKELVTLAQNEVLANIQAAGGALGKLVKKQLATQADTSLLKVAANAAETQRHASRRELASRWQLSVRGHVATLRRGTAQLRERSVGARDLIWRTGMKAEDLTTLQVAQEAVSRGVGSAAVGERAKVPRAVADEALSQVVESLAKRGFDRRQVGQFVSDVQARLAADELSVQQVRKAASDAVGRLFAERKDETAYQLALLAAQSRGTSRVKFLEPLRKFLDPALSYIGVGSKNLVAAYRAGDEILTGYQASFAAVVERVVASPEMKKATSDQEVRNLFVAGMDEFFSGRGDHTAGIPADARTILQRAYSGLFDSNPAAKGPTLDPELELAQNLQVAKEAAAKAVEDAESVSERTRKVAMDAAEETRSKADAVSKLSARAAESTKRVANREADVTQLEADITALKDQRDFQSLVEQYADKAIKELNQKQSTRAILKRKNTDPPFDMAAFRAGLDTFVRTNPGALFQVPAELRAGDVASLLTHLQSRRAGAIAIQKQASADLLAAQAKLPNLKSLVAVAKQDETTIAAKYAAKQAEYQAAQAVEAAAKTAHNEANRAWRSATEASTKAATEFDSLPAPLRKRLEGPEADLVTDPLIEQLARSLFSGVQAQDLDQKQAQTILSGAAKAVLRSPDRPETFGGLMDALKAQIMQRFQGNPAVLDDRFVRSTVFLGSVLLQAATRDAVAQAALRNAVAVTDARSARAINKLLLASDNDVRAPMAGSEDLAKAIEDMLRMGYRLGRTKEGVAAEFGGKVLGGGREGAQLSVAVSEATQQALDSGVWVPANLTDALASSAEVLYKELDKLPTVNPNAVGAAFYGAARGVFGLWRTKVLVGLGINPLGYRFRTLFGDSVALSAYLGPKYGIQHAATAVPQFVPFKGQQALKASFRAAAWAEALTKPWLDPAKLDKYPTGYRKRVLAATQKMLSPAVSAFFQLYPKEIGEVLSGEVGTAVRVGDTEATVGQWFEEMKRQSVFDNNVETGLHTAMQEAGQAMEDAIAERIARAENVQTGLDLVDETVAATKARPNSAASRALRWLRKAKNKAKQHQRGLESSEAQVAKQQRAVMYLSLRRSGFSESEAGELLRDNLMDWRLGVNRAMATLTAWSPFARYHILDQRRTVAALFSGDWLTGKTPWRRASLLMKYEASLFTETGYTEDDLDQMVEDMKKEGMTEEAAVDHIAVQMFLEAAVPRWAQGKLVDYEALTAEQLHQAQTKQAQYDFQMRPQGYYHVRRSSGLREGFDLATTTAQIMAVAYHQMVGEQEVAADWMLKIATPWLDRAPDIVSAEVYRRMSAGDAALEAMYGNQDSGGLFSSATPQEAYVAGVLSNWVTSARPYYPESERDKSQSDLTPGRLQVPRDALLAIRAFDAVFPLAMQGVNATKYRNPEYFDRWNSGTDMAEFAWGTLSALWGLDRAYAADPHVQLQMRNRLVAKETAAAAKSAQQSADRQTRASPEVLRDLTTP